MEQWEVNIGILGWVFVPWCILKIEAAEKGVEREIGKFLHTFMMRL